MKSILRHRLLLGLMLTAALLNIAPPSAFAAANSGKITPAVGTSQPGNTFTVGVSGHASGDWWYSTSSVNGTLKFPANLLSVEAIDKTGQSFAGGSNVTFDNTTGTINFSGSCNWWFCGYQNQNVHFFQVTFKSLAPGTANVIFEKLSYNSGGGATTGGVYTITAPPAPPTPTPTPIVTQPTPTPKLSTKPVTTPVSTPPPSPVAVATEELPTPTADSDGGLKIQDVKVSVSRQESKVTWKVNSTATTPTFIYGASKAQQTKSGVVVDKKDGNYEVVLSELKPGTLFHFTIKTATNDSLQGASYNGTLTTRGYPVQLTVQQNNLLLPGAKVKINDRTFVANKDAIITTELSDGEHTADIAPSGSSDSYPIKFVVAKKSVPANGNPEQQNFMLNITTTGTTSGIGSTLLLPIIGAIVAAIAVIGGIVGFILLRKKQAADNQSAGIDSDMLAASYGRPVETLYQNTPTPNLETHGMAQNGIFQEQPIQQQTVDPTMPTSAAGSYDAYQQPATDPTQTYIPQANVDQLIAPAYDPAMNQPYVPQDSQQYDTNSLPLPPQSDPIATAPDITTPTPTQYTEEEQLTSELVKVESSEDPTRPDAVYDEVTGELDILHGNHHNVAPAESEELNSVTSDEPPSNVLDIQHGNSDEVGLQPQSPAGALQ